MMSKPTILTALELSSIHLDVSSIAVLERAAAITHDLTTNRRHRNKQRHRSGGAGEIICYRTEDGWQISTDLVHSNLDEVNFPVPLLAILELGRRHGCAYIVLDSAGPVVDELAVLDFQTSTDNDNDVNNVVYTSHH